MRRVSLIVAILLVLGACSNGSSSTTNPESSASTSSGASIAPVANVDHWHEVYGFLNCGEYLPFVREQSDPYGIHSHADGVIHIHPFSAEYAGRNATLGVFLDAIGASLSDDGLKFADGSTMSAKGECGNQDAALTLIEWADPESTDPSALSARYDTDAAIAEMRDTPLADRATIVLALLPDRTGPASIERPPWQRNLDALTDVVPSSSSSSSGGAPSASGAVPPSRESLAFQPVLAAGVGGCASPRAKVVPDAGGLAECLTLGPAITPSVDDAEAVIGGDGENWAVHLTLTSEGIAQFNELATLCNAQDDHACPSGRVAIISRGVVLSAPTVQQPSFERDQIQIVGAFTESEAKQLADVLNA